MWLVRLNLKCNGTGQQHISGKHIIAERVRSTTCMNKTVNAALADEISNVTRGMVFVGGRTTFRRASNRETHTLEQQRKRIVCSED